MNTKEIPKNKLSIYLIKEEHSYTKNKELVKNCKGVGKINEVDDFYYGHSEYKTPPWLDKFFREAFDNRIISDKDKKKNKSVKHKLFSATASGVFFVDVEGRKFAITFGYGRTFLKKEVYEERFGLKSALNLIEENSFRAIEKKNMVRDPKLSIEQISRNRDIHNFGIDTEQVLILGVTGKSNRDDFPSIIAGKDALSISVEYDIHNIDKLLRKCLKIYKSDKYKKDFDWIDHTNAIKSKETIEELDNKLVKNIKSGDFDALWMSIPDIIEWKNISGFRFNEGSLVDDIDMESYLSYVKDRKNLSLTNIKNHSVYSISTDGNNIVDNWTVYHCLYCEIEEKDKVNILSGGQWHEVERSFTKKILKSFNEIRKDKINLPLPKSKKGEHEDLYNKRAVREANEFSCMDKELVPFGVGGRGIEFGDLLTIDGKIIHVKRGTHSSVLSHLFAQGVISGTLFNEEDNFRKNLSSKLVEVLGDKLGSEYKKIYTDNIPDPREYKIIYAIISDHAKDKLDIPFFSKINIRNAKRKLEGMGYKVYLYHIPIDATVVCKESLKRNKQRKSKK